MTISTCTLVSSLATITTRDDAGKHFTDRYSEELLDELERLELIEISRPTHGPTGMDCDRQQWTAEVTDAGQALVDAYPEYHPNNIRAAVLDQAKADAAAFVQEFGEALDPGATDWDAAAWEKCRESIEGSDDLWDDYQAALVAETERLVSELPAITYQIKQGHTWAAPGDLIPWEVTEEAESSSDATGTVECGGETYRWIRNA